MFIPKNPVTSVVGASTEVTTAGTAVAVLALGFVVFAWGVVRRRLSRHRSASPSSD